MLNVSLYDRYENISIDVSYSDIKKFKVGSLIERDVQNGKLIPKISSGYRPKYFMLGFHENEESISLLLQKLEADQVYETMCFDYSLEDFENLENVYNKIYGYNFFDGIEFYTKYPVYLYCNEKGEFSRTKPFESAQFIARLCNTFGSSIMVKIL